jgi:hypothetical protein
VQRKKSEWKAEWNWQVLYIEINLILVSAYLMIYIKLKEH